MLRETRFTTPEKRLLQRHYDLMGIDDRQHVARLDPSQHLLHCRCAQCDKTPKPCPIDGCAKVLEGTIKLAAHLERHRMEAMRAGRTERAARRKQMEPVGLGFIERLLGDPERAARLDLRGLRTFEQKLLAAAGPTGGRRQARHIAKSRLLLETIEACMDGTSEFGTRVPNTTASVITRFAILAGVHPRTVTAALIAWGIERFVEQVRTSGLVTEPHVERDLGVPPAAAGNRLAPAFPRADEDLE